MTHFQVQLLQGEEWTGEEHVSEILVRLYLYVWDCVCNALLCLRVFLSVLIGVFTVDMITIMTLINLKLLQKFGSKVQ